MSEYTISVADLVRVLGVSERSVWRWLRLSNGKKLAFRRSVTPDDPTGKTHMYRISDLFGQIRSVRRVGLSETELADLLKIDFERRRQAH